MLNTKFNCFLNPNFESAISANFYHIFVSVVNLLLLIKLSLNCDMKIFNKYFFIISLIIFSVSFLFISCDDTLTTANVDSKIIPTSNVSFAEHIYPVLQVKCAFTGCHAGASPAGGLDLTSWVNVTADPNVVFPKEPNLSRLVWTINGTAGVPEMPPRYSGLVLTQNQIQGIITWIKEGALNN